jgi:large subunit ribosomal protein L24
VDKEASIHVSNVMLFNAAAGKGERTGIKALEDGRRVRFFKRSGEVADV